LYAQRIREAMAGAIDTAKLAQAWAALHPGAFADEAGPAASATKAVNPALAAFLARAAQAIRDALAAVLGQLWPEAWVLGQQAAQAVLTGAAVDWRGWTPGDHAAAEQIAGDGLQRLLADADIRIKSIAESRVNELADALEASLASDVREIEPYHKPPGVYSMQDVLPARNSIGDLAAKLENVLDNPARAKMVAHTEMARAQSAATLESYGQTGVRERSWLGAGDAKECPVCDANEAQGAVPMGQPFTGGVLAPPQHPMCRCALMPVVG